MTPISDSSLLLSFFSSFLSLDNFSSQVGKCRSLHVLSLRENDLTYLPDEIGKLTELRVLDVCGNR